MSDWYVVINSATGEAYSIGTVVADPLPSRMLSLPLSEIDAASINAGRAYWDAASRAVVMRLPQDWPTVPE